MTRSIRRFAGPDSRIRGILRSRDRFEVPFGVLFLLALVTGTALWDGMTVLAPANSADWTGVIVSAVLCVVFFFLSRRRLALLLCAAFLISVRLTFVFAESVPADSIGLAADCLGACTALSVIVFRTEIQNMWRRVRGSRTECAPAVASSV